MQLQGRARSFTEATEVVVVINHPTEVSYRSLQRIQEYAWKLYDSLDDVGDTRVMLYREMRISGTSGRCRRRNILGDGLHWLTGLATSKEVEEVRQQVTDLLGTLHQHDIVIKDTIACVKADPE